MKPEKGDAPKEPTPSKKTRGRGGMRALSPLRHGFFFKGPLIPGVESMRDLRRFQSKMIEALRPRDEYQRWLVRRIVSLARKLDLQEAYEAAVIEKGQEPLEEVIMESRLEETLLKEVLKSGPRYLEVLNSLAHPSAESRIKGQDAVETLGILGKLTGLRITEVMNLPPIEVEDILGPRRHPLLKDWTPAAMLELIVANARRFVVDPEDLRQGCVDSIEGALADAEEQLKTLAARRDRRLRLHLLPDPDELDRIQGRETHLWRLLQRAVDLLDAAQARDRGERIPRARLDIVS